MSLNDLLCYSADSNLFPPKGAILFAASWAYVPERILRFVEYLPARQFYRFRQFLLHGKRLGKDLINNKAASIDAKQKSRDILSILGPYIHYLWILGSDPISHIVEANKAQTASNRLDEDEILSQIT
jgi:hypothetical protein